MTGVGTSLSIWSPKRDAIWRIPRRSMRPTDLPPRGKSAIGSTLLGQDFGGAGPPRNSKGTRADSFSYSFTIMHTSAYTFLYAFNGPYQPRGAPESRANGGANRQFAARDARSGD